jgi:hypothetical protein
VQKNINNLRELEELLLVIPEKLSKSLQAIELDRKTGDCPGFSFWRIRAICGSENTVSDERESKSS